MNETIFFREPRDEAHPFARMPKALMYDKRLSFRDRIVMGTILDNADTWKLSIAEIGRRLCMDKNTLKKASQKLQETGWLKIEKTGFGTYRWEIYETPQGLKKGPTEPIIGPNKAQELGHNTEQGLINKPCVESKPATQGLFHTLSINQACNENKNKGEHLEYSMVVDTNNDILNIFQNDKEEDFTLSEEDLYQFKNSLRKTNTLRESKEKLEQVEIPYKE
jgi:hypothetical protein